MPRSLPVLALCDIHAFTGGLLLEKEKAGQAYNLPSTSGRQADGFWVAARTPVLKHSSLFSSVHAASTTFTPTTFPSRGGPDNHLLSPRLNAVARGFLLLLTRHCHLLLLHSMVVGTDLCRAAFARCISSIISYFGQAA